jgi:flagellar basal body P-ring formation protein FlgA
MRPILLLRFLALCLVLPTALPVAAAAGAAAGIGPGKAPAAAAAAKPTSKTAAQATAESAAQAAAQAPDQLESWLRQSVKLPDGQQLRVQVQVGTINRALKLAPCDKAEPFLPTNTRLWGRANVGLRCVAGARWTTFIPVRVSAYGPALVARAMLPAGRVPQEDDFVVQEVDWAASRSTPVASRSLLEGQELIRPVAAGHPLLAEYLRIAPTIRAGEPVPVIVQGQGFSIGIEAVALSAAADGQQVRVRTGTGKVLNGTVDGRSVKIIR